MRRGAGREEGGEGVEAGRQMLHAWRLKIPSPGETEPREFEAPQPEDFQVLLERLARA
jgi:23S rRNA-/tRNA-specific pseudouridylate synthase